MASCFRSVVTRRLLISLIVSHCLASYSAAIVLIALKIAHIWQSLSQGIPVDFVMNIFAYVAFAPLSVPISIAGSRWLHTIPREYVALCLAYCIVFILILDQRRRPSLAARRYEAGRCVVCGYDLRRSASRCPECGHARTSDMK